MTCVCVWLGAGWEVLGVSGDMIGFGFYSFWRNMEKVGYVCVLVAVVRVVLGESGWAAWARVCEGRVVLCHCVL